MSKDEKFNVFMRFYQIIIIILSAIYIIFIWLKKYENTPPVLIIISLLVSFLYLCATGYFKLCDMKKDINEIVVDYYKGLYIVTSIIAIIIGTFFSFFINEINTLWADTLTVIALAFTLCVQILTDCVCWIVIKRSKVKNNIHFVKLHKRIFNKVQTFIKSIK